MTHEPECLSFANGDFCLCPEVRAAYKRGIADARTAVEGAYVVCSNGSIDHNRTWNLAIDTALEYLDHPAVRP